jgi:hypothetical protein
VPHNQLPRSKISGKLLSAAGISSQHRIAANVQPCTDRASCRDNWILDLVSDGRIDEDTAGLRGSEDGRYEALEDFVGLRSPFPVISPRTRELIGTPQFFLFITACGLNGELGELACKMTARSALSRGSARLKFGSLLDDDNPHPPSV